MTLSLPGSMCGGGGHLALTQGRRQTRGKGRSLGKQRCLSEALPCLWTVEQNYKTQIPGRNLSFGEISHQNQVAE